MAVREAIVCAEPSCTETFPRNAVGRPRKYCSSSCRERARRQRHLERRRAADREYGRKRRATDPEFRRKALEWKERNPERFRRHQWAYQLRSKYGLSVEDYERLLADQGGACAICGTDDPTPWPQFGVDHCHTTGTVRGLLCQGCNIAIGRMHDEPELLRAAARYLEAS